MVGRLTRSRDQLKIEALLSNPRRREDGLRQLAASSLRNAASIAATFLNDRDEFVRNAALECLRERGSRRYAIPVSEHLGDSAEIVRTSAIECLVAWGFRAATPQIAGLLLDRSPLVRAYAAWALGRLRARRAVVLLESRLRSERRKLARAGALEALAVLTRRDQYINELLTLLLDPDHAVRCFVANSLVGTVTSKTKPRIISALREALSREATVAAKEAFRKNLAMLAAV